MTCQDCRGCMPVALSGLCLPFDKQSSELGPLCWLTVKCLMSNMQSHSRSQHFELVLSELLLATALCSHSHCCQSVTHGFSLGLGSCERLRCRCVMSNMQSHSRSRQQTWQQYSVGQSALASPSNFCQVCYQDLQWLCMCMCITHLQRKRSRETKPRV